VLAAIPTASLAVLSTAAPFRRDPAAGLPQRVRILAWGENIGRTTRARILVDEVVAETLSAHQELVACDTVPMDYEHQSVKGHPNYLPDPRLSPGHGKIEVIPGDGVYLSSITYTANGEAHADSYQDVSAVVHLDAEGRPLWVSSVALTQRGDVAGMEFSESVEALSARVPMLPLPGDSSTQNQNQIMENTDTEQTFRGLIITLLGLTPGDSGEISDEEIIAAVESKSKTAPADKEDSTAALSADMDNLRRDFLVDRATRDGKVIPLSAEEIKTTPVAVLSSIIDKLQAGEVPLVTTAAKEVPSDKVTALSAEESAAAKALGLTEDEYRKTQSA
jgi:phage I-like protein